MTELMAEGAQEASDSFDPESDTSKCAGGKDVGRCAASLRDIVNEAMEPKVPAETASEINKVLK